MELDKSFIEDIKQTLRQARNQVMHQVNSLMVQTYFEIGKKIVEQEQAGKQYATYGTFLLKHWQKASPSSLGRVFQKEILN